MNIGSGTRTKEETELSSPDVEALRTLYEELEFFRFLKELGTEAVPFDERVVVRECLEELGVA